MNEITGRKKVKGQVTGSTPEERVDTWLSRFRNLKAKLPLVEEPDEEIQHMFEDLVINDVEF